MRNLFVILIAGILSACAVKPTGKVQGQIEDRDPYVTYLREGDRNPAGEPRVEWERGVESFEVGPQGGSINITLNPRNVMTWEERVPYQDLELRLVPYTYPGTCERYVCPSSSSAGSAAWNQVFSSMGATARAKALSEAVKGIGEKSSESLIKKQYFRYKPKSWTEFEEEIIRARDNNVITGSVAQGVLEKYRAENQSILGYEPSTCAIKVYSCTKYGERFQQFPVTKYRLELKSKVLETKSKSFNVVVQSPILDSFERDLISVSMGESDSDVIVNLAGSKTVYQVNVDHNKSQITLIGTGRYKTNLPQSVVSSGDLIYNKQAKKAELKLNFDVRYVVSNPTDSGDQLVLKYSVFKCKQNFFGYCKGDYVAGNAQYKVITNPSEVISFEIEKNERMYVAYAVTRLNSPYYSDAYTNLIETSKVNRNK